MSGVTSLTPVNTYQTTNVRTISVFDLSDIESVLGVEKILAIYKVGDRVEVVTDSQ